MHEFLEKLEKEENYFSYAIDLVDGILEKLEEIDSLITELVTNWEFSRIAKTDLAILRLGIYEILFRLDVPPVVVIDEALEISKDFSSDNSRKFLNGVLDQASKRSGRPNRERLVKDGFDSTRQKLSLHTHLSDAMARKPIFLRSSRSRRLPSKKMAIGASSVNNRVIQILKFIPLCK